MAMCEEISKTSLMGLNIVSLITGGIIVVVGVIIKSNYGQYLEHVEIGEFKSASDLLSTAPLLFIVLGILVVLLSLCGCCGTYFEKTWLLQVYKASLILILMILLITATLAIIFKELLEQVVEIIVRNFQQMYTVTPSIMDLIQANMECCGVISYRDWSHDPVWLNHARDLSRNPNITLGSNPVPNSCCIEGMKSGCGLTFENTLVQNTIYYEGCADILWFSLLKNAKLIGFVGLTVVILVITCIVSSYCVINVIEKPSRQIRDCP